MIKTKIIWKKPEEHFARVSNKEIDKMCKEDFCGNTANVGTGDIKIERSQYGRKITFIVYRVEKVGEMVEGLETLSRTKAIEELMKINSETHRSKEQ